eukprot:1360106-Pyramimonas_sp.AAC.1
MPAEGTSHVRGERICDATCEQWGVDLCECGGGDAFRPRPAPQGEGERERSHHPGRLQAAQTARAQLQRAVMSPY